MATIRFGSNTFSAGNSFTIVGLDDSGNLIIGGFGPPPSVLRIPTQIGHPFRSKPATYSVPNRPVIPIQTGHPLTKVSDAG